MKALLISFALIVCAAAAYAADPVSVYVFTVTNAEGFVDLESKHRADSVADLKQALLKRKFVIAETADTADLSLEVTLRGYFENGELSTTTTRVPYTGYPGITNSTTTKNEDQMLHVVLTVGTYTKEFRQDDGMGYRAKANNIAKDVERWVKENAATLAAR